MKDFLRRGNFELLALALLQLVWYEVGQFLAFRALSYSGSIFIISITEIAVIGLILWHIFYRKLTSNHRSAIVYMIISLLISIGFGIYFSVATPFLVEVRMVGAIALILLSIPGTLSTAMFATWIFKH